MRVDLLPVEIVACPSCSGVVSRLWKIEALSPLSRSLSLYSLRVVRRRGRNVTCRKRRRRKAGVIIDYRTFNTLLASRQVVESSANFLRADRLRSFCASRMCVSFFQRFVSVSFSFSRERSWSVFLTEFGACFWMFRYREM